MAPFREYVIDEILAWQADGYQTALVTLINIEGSAPRPLGAQMAVRSDGEAVGLITGGCAEASIIEEAVVAIGNGRNRTLRYGAGSPFVDIQLPCGSGIDLRIDVLTDLAVYAAVNELRSQRRLCAVRIGPDGTAILEENEADDESEISGLARQVGESLIRYYAPSTRLLAIGRGQFVAALSQIGRLTGLETIAFSPEQDLLADLSAEGLETHGLNRPQDFQFEPLDRWTAAAIGFHDHDWEPSILQHLLSSDCFYIGALGSRATHNARLELLRDSGVSEKTTDRIHAPIGMALNMSNGSKNPVEIAVAVIAEILAERP